jgi:hypothetical protein
MTLKESLKMKVLSTKKNQATPDRFHPGNTNNVISKVIFAVCLMVMAVTLNPSNAQCAEIYISDDFESGNLDKWDYVNEGKTWLGGYVEPRTDNPHNGLYSCAMRMIIPPESPEHRDTNPRIQHSFDSPKPNDTVSLRGYLYMANRNFPTDGDSSTKYKLYYVFSDDWYNDDHKWDVILEGLHNKGSKDWALKLVQNSYSYTNFPTVWPADEKWENNGNHLNYDQWYCIEMTVKLNDPGSSNGWIKIYIDDELILDHNNLIIRDNDAAFGWVGVGYQVDRDGDTEKRDSIRYWDDIVISSDYVGPTDIIENAKLQTPPNFQSLK